MSKTRILLLILAAAALLFVAAVIMAADQGNLSPYLKKLYAFPNGDKVGHFLLMGSMAFCVGLALPSKWNTLGLLILAVVITIEEISQLFFTTRTFSLADLLCSLAGVLVFGLLAVWLQNYRLNHKKKLIS